MARRFLHSTLFPAVITLAACASMNGIAPQTSPRDANTLAAQRSLQDTRVDTATWPGQVWWKSLGTRNSLQATLSWDLDFRGTNRAAYEAALGTARAAEVDAQAEQLALSAALVQAYEQGAAVATARDACDLALLRYLEGVGHYLQTLSAEQAVLAQQSLDADLHARARHLPVNLVRALGGGYEPSPALATGT
jgi:outer membrane protein TolC